MADDTLLGIFDKYEFEQLLDAAEIDDWFRELITQRIDMQTVILSMLKFNRIDSSFINEYWIINGIHNAIFTCRYGFGMEETIQKYWDT